MSEFEDESYPLTALAKKYLDALLRKNEYEASNMILNALKEVKEVKDIYLHVFEPSQHEVGRLWQAGLITVAQEHFCTASTLRIMSQLYPYLSPTDKNGRQLVAACASGETHEIGLRMVADFFEMEGWDTYYLGANTPIESILDTIIDLKPDVVALSASIESNVELLADLISSIRESPQTSNIKILVGGRPFFLAPHLYKEIGADGSPSNAKEAVALANELLSP